MLSVLRLEFNNYFTDLKIIYFYKLYRQNSTVLIFVRFFKFDFMNLNKFKTFFLLITVVIAIPNTMAAKYDLKVNWKYKIVAPEGRSAGVCSPLPFPNADNPNSLVLSVGYGVVRLDAWGKEMFKYVTAENTMTPAIGDLYGNGKAEIVIPTDAGVIYCIDGKGTLLWKTDLKDDLYNFGCAVIADIDGDGKMETLLNARAGTIYCLNSNGSIRWKVLAEPRACSPAVGDIDGDGKAEIFYGTDVGKIFCLDYQGRYLWHTEIPEREFGRSAPILADLEGNGRYDLLMPHSNTTPYPAIVDLDAHLGKLKWTGNTIMQNYGGTTVVDLDHNGKPDVIVVDKGNVVNTFTYDGQLKWQTTLSGHGIFFAAGVADFFNDGHYELLCGCRQTGPAGQTMFLLNNKGEVIREYKEGGDRNSSPMIADLNGDKIPEIYTSDGSSEKVVACYTLEGSKAGGGIPWSCWKRTPTNNGFIKSNSNQKVPIGTSLPASITETATQAAFIGKNSCNLSLPPTYKGTEIFAETRISGDEQTMESTFNWLENKDNLVEIPFNVRTPDDHDLEITIRDRKSKEIIIHKLLKITASGYSKDKDFIKVSANEMNAIAQGLPASDFSLGSDLTSKINQLATAGLGITDSKDQAVQEAANKMVESNRKKTNLGLRYARFLSQVRKKGNKGSFFVWQDPNPWDDVQPGEIYPSDPEADTARLSILAMGNETEALAFYLTNLKESPQQVKIYPHDLTDKEGKTVSCRDIVELREAINTPDNVGTIVDEVLPKLNEGNTMYLAPYDSRKLWMNINTKSLAAGRYNFLLDFESIGLISTVQRVKVTLVVSTVRIPQKSEYAFCTWSSLAITDDIMRAKVTKDMLDHKMSVLPVSGPRFYVDPNQKLAEDWSQWDNYYSSLKDQMTCFLINPLSVETGGREISKEQYASLLKEAYVRTSKGFTDRGIGPKQWSVYVMDEPGITGYPSIESGIQTARQIREAAPSAELYIDPAGMISPKSMKGFEGLINTYCPQVDLLKDQQGKLLNYFHDLGQRNWFYEAVGPSRTLHPLGYYRVQPWLAFDYGFTGSGFWCCDYSNNTNLWRAKSANPSSQDNYSVVYNDGLNIIPSRRWEASRDGIEDYHLLMMLKRKIAEFKNGSKEQMEIAGKADEVMRQIVQRITSNVKKVKEINREFIPYDVDYSLFVEGRKQLIGYLERMNRISD